MSYFERSLKGAWRTLIRRTLPSVVLIGLLYTPTANGQAVGALEEFLGIPPLPPPVLDPDAECPLYSFEIQYISEEMQPEESLVNWSAASPGLSCLEGHIDQAISRCEAHWDSSWDHWDNCIAQGYFMNEIAYNDGTYANIDSPGFQPSLITCAGQQYVGGTEPASCYVSPREATFFFDENCNSIVLSDISLASQACDTAVLSWWGSPISLLWEDDVDIENDVRFTQFQLDPARKGKWYEWKASAQAPLLVYDPQNSGLVHSATQLFGDWTFGGKTKASTASLRSSSTTMSLPTKWENGYQALAQLDQDQDGKISGKELSPLALWFDNNRDGVSQKGEVISATDTGLLTLFYKPDKHDKAKRTIGATIGFERLKDNRVVSGPSVDWYGEEGDSEQELVQKHMARAALCSGEGAFPDSEAALPKKEEKTIEEIKSTVGAAYSGVWDWKTVFSTSAAAKKAQGILTISTTGTRVVGHSMVELILKDRFAGKSVISLFPLTGALVTSEDGNILKFSVISGGRSAGKSEARLSADGTTLHGKTQIRMKYNGKAVNFAYAWKATRRSKK